MPNNINQSEMDTKFSVSAQFKYIIYGMIIIGVLAFVYGFITNPLHSWANLLLNNYYFLSLAIGASFFIALQYISQSGWSSMFKRVPEAMASFIPVAGVIAVVLLFGMKSLYHWSHAEEVAHDPLLAHKSPYLNPVFFIIRLVIFFAVWIIMTRILRRFSLKEDIEGGMVYFVKSEFYSKVYIFILAFTFSLATFDWIMSIDAHWFSTIFALKGFVAAFYHGTAIVTLLVLFLNDSGYFPKLNKSHLLDFSRYLFMLSIVFGYLWFVEFMLIWYANIPEETIYFVIRWNGSWKTLFFLNIILNWFLPFMLLLSQKMDKNKTVLKFVCFILIIGQYVNLYIQIMPGTVGGIPSFGFIEIGSFIGFAGLFLIVFAYTFSKASIIPKNHPYLEESLEHHLH